MNEKALLKALDMIAGGTTDTYPPYRGAPREVLMKFAARVADNYREQQLMVNEQMVNEEFGIEDKDAF